MIQKFSLYIRFIITLDEVKRHAGNDATPQTENRNFFLKSIRVAKPR